MSAIPACCLTLGDAPIDPIVRIAAGRALMEPACIDAVQNAYNAMPGYQYTDNVADIAAHTRGK